MVKNHLKTIAAPKSWPVQRKSRKFIMRPNAGPHSLTHAVSLNFLIIEMLHLAQKRKEVVTLLHNKEVRVEGVRRKDPAFPVGLFDVISIKDIKKSFRIILDGKGRFKAIEEKGAQASPKKIMGKALYRGKFQLRMHDGRTILTDKKDIKVGDSIIVEKNKVKEHFKLQKGSPVFLTGGRHLGEMGAVEDIVGRKIIYKIGKNIVHETLRRYAFVTGKDKPVLKIEQ
ncbi:hypothetical protein GOV09_00300 [Candidatus Woesearchaeota archaeon]|nr:hypothetical protein [Candidatus Woesearchaeota archaeon]